MVLLGDKIVENSVIGEHMHPKQIQQRKRMSLERMGKTMKNTGNTNRKNRKKY